MNPEELRQRLTLIVAENPVNQCWTLSTVHLLKLVEKAVEAEREACAKVCDRFIGTTMVCQAERIQSAIRVRGESKHRNVDKVYMSEKHVHKSDKSIHEREWVGLTDEERRRLVLDDSFDWVAAVEAKLKEKNCG